MRAHRRPLVQFSRGIAIEGNFGQPAANNRAGAGLNFLGISNLARRNPSVYRAATFIFCFAKVNAAMGLLRDGS
jgi:hypothetical protein